MIIYCYDMNSLSCLSRFSRDPPNVVLILIQKMNFFFFVLRAQFFFFFYGYRKQGQNPSVIFVCCLCPLVENASNPTSLF